MTRPDPVSTLELRPPDLAPEVCGLLCGYRKGSSLRAREAKPENCKAGLVGLRGTVDPQFGLMKRHAEEMASILRAAGAANMPIGVDIVEPPMMFELEKAGLNAQGCC
jgi:hypothetical protein